MHGSITCPTRTSAQFFMKLGHLQHHPTGTRQSVVLRQTKRHRSTARPGSLENPRAGLSPLNATLTQQCVCGGRQLPICQPVFDISNRSSRHDDLGISSYPPPISPSTLTRHRPSLKSSSLPTPSKSQNCSHHSAAPKPSPSPSTPR